MQVPAALLSVVKRLEGWIVAAAEDMYSLCGGKQDNSVLSWYCFYVLSTTPFLHPQINAIKIKLRKFRLDLINGIKHAIWKENPDMLFLSVLFFG